MKIWSALTALFLSIALWASAIENGDFHSGSAYWSSYSWGTGEVTFVPDSYLNLYASSTPEEWGPYVPPELGGAKIRQMEGNFVDGEIWKVEFDLTCGFWNPSDLWLGWENPAGDHSRYATYMFEHSGTVTFYCDDPEYRYVTAGVECEFPDHGYASMTISEIRTQRISSFPSGPHRCTFFGGDEWEYGSSLALDKEGIIYLIGTTNSDNIPVTPGAFDQTFNGGRDIFIAKFDPTLSDLYACTYLGGADDEEDCYMKVDADGNVYVAGTTFSDDFPTTPETFDPDFNGDVDYSDVFVTKLNSNLSSIVYSTFIGGTHGERVGGMHLDQEENVYITGWTNSFDFPVTPGAYDTTNYNEDIFLCKINSSGSSLIFSTFLGGSDYDNSSGIILDGNQNIYITGESYSSDFPVTPGAYDTSPFVTPRGYITSGFITCFNPDCSDIIYSTFYTPEFNDMSQWQDIGCDSLGNIYVGKRDLDIQIAKMNPMLSQVLYYRKIGPLEAIGEFDMDVVGNGIIYVAGTTQTMDFPITQNAFDTEMEDLDGFFLCLDSRTDEILYSTFLGNIDNDDVTFVAHDDDYIYISGYTDSLLCPRTRDAYDIIHNGGLDAFVFKLPSPVKMTSAEGIWIMYE